MNSTIAVVTHKDYEMPHENCYKAFFVGDITQNKEDSDSYLKDGTAINIAEKNKNYCELTAQYWLWKNLSNSDVKGLVHYRRHFKSDDKYKSKKMMNSVLKKQEIEELLNKYDCILPIKRNYYIETTYTHYKNAHNISDLTETRNIITELYPEYEKTFDYVMEQKKSHRFNMMIANADVFDDYSEWLFRILFELEKRIDISEYDVYQSRVFGFISERLLDVWIEYNEIKYIEKPFMFMEKQNWFVKGFNFIQRKTNIRN